MPKHKLAPFTMTYCQIQFRILVTREKKEFLVIQWEDKIFSIFVLQYAHKH